MGYYKQITTHIMGVPEEEAGQRLFEEIMNQNFLNMRKEINIQVQEAQRIPTRMDPKRPILRHIITKLKSQRQRES